MEGEIEPKESLNHFKNAIEEAIPKLEDAEYIVIYNTRCFIL